MKIILIESLTPRPVATFLPDSALLRPGTPLFYPETDTDWTLRPLLAVRLNRLGKGVAPRFAARYYDSIAPALMLNRPGGFPSPLQAGTDGSLAIGAYIPAADMPATITLATPGYEAELHPDADLIAKAIAAVSSYVIIKMGDILLLSPALGSEVGPDPIPDIPLTPHTRLTLPPHIDFKIV